MYATRSCCLPALFRAPSTQNRDSDGGVSTSTQKRSAVKVAAAPAQSPPQPPPRAAVDITIPTAEAMARAKASRTSSSSSSSVSSSVSFGDAMNWNGWAPEVINGRCAMVGFVCARAGQAMSDADVSFMNLAHDHVAAMGSVILTIIVASFAPSALSRGAYTGEPTTKEDANETAFTASKEMIHGRLAMLAILAEVVLEMTQ
jgi:hypothetical protein